MPANTTQYISGGSNSATKALATSAYPTVINSTVAGTSPLFEQLAFPMSNLLNRDRYVTWACSDGDGVDEDSDGKYEVAVELEFAAGVSIGVMGVLGMALGTGAVVSQAYWYYKTIAGGWGSAWTAFPGSPMTLSGSDSMALVTGGNVTSIKFLRVVFKTNGYGFSVGKLLTCPVASLVDLGVVYAPGSTETVVMQRSRVRMLDGHEVVTRYGNSRYAFAMNFPCSDNTRYQRIKTLSQSLISFVLLAPSGDVLEVRAIADTFSAEARWGVAGSTSSDQWNCALEVESLP